MGIFQRRKQVKILVIPDIFCFVLMNGKQHLSSQSHMCQVDKMRANIEEKLIPEIRISHFNKKKFPSWNVI